MSLLLDDYHMFVDRTAPSFLLGRYCASVDADKAPAAIALAFDVLALVARATILVIATGEQAHAPLLVDAEGCAWTVSVVAA